MSPTGWAVWCGCTTPVRLADEWRISVEAATAYLWAAVKRGEVYHVRAGEFEVFNLKDVK